MACEEVGIKGEEAILYQDWGRERRSFTLEKVDHLMIEIHN